MKAVMHDDKGHRVMNLKDKYRAHAKDRKGVPTRGKK